MPFVGDRWVLGVDVRYYKKAETVVIIPSPVGDVEEGFDLRFTIRGRPAPSRVHHEFARHLQAANIGWIVPHREFCRIDLTAAKRAIPFLSADWMVGTIDIEPAVTEGYRGFVSHISLTVLREDIVSHQRNGIFLSHKSSNKPLVRRVHSILEILGFRPWLDEENIVAGDNLHRSLLDAMQRSCAAVFFVTPEFRDDRYLRHEIDLALAEKTTHGDRFAVITLAMMNETGERGHVPDILRAHVYKEPSTESEALREILRALPLKVGEVRWRSDLLQNGAEQPKAAKQFSMPMRFKAEPIVIGPDTPPKETRAKNKRVSKKRGRR